MMSVKSIPLKTELNGKEASFIPFFPQMTTCEFTEIPCGSGILSESAFLCGFVLRNTRKEPVEYPIIPDTCTALVFLQTDRHMAGWFCGTSDSLRKLQLEPGDSVAVLRFKPGDTRVPFVGELGGLTNRSLSLTDGFPEGENLLRIMEKDLPMEERALLLTGQLQRTRLQPEAVQLLHHCMDLIIRAHGNIRISEVAGNTGFSERYIGKVFERMIGLSPKLYSEMIRMQYAVRQIRNREEQKSLLELSMDCGYFDHAHMNREFNKFLKCSAGNLRKKGFTVIDMNRIEPYIQRSED